MKFIQIDVTEGELMPYDKCNKETSVIGSLLCHKTKTKKGSYGISFQGQFITDDWYEYYTFEKGYETLCNRYTITSITNDNMHKFKISINVPVEKMPKETLLPHIKNKKINDNLVHAYNESMKHIRNF